MRISVGLIINLLNNDHVVFFSLITGVQIHSLKDSGAISLAFIDSSFARKHNFPLTPLPEARTLKIFNGRDIIAGKVTNMAFFPFLINFHHEQILFFVTKLSQYPVIFSLPWLKLHDVTSKWAANTVRFESLYCKRHYLAKSPFTIYGYVPEIKKDAPLKLNIAQIGAAPFSLLFKRKEMKMFTMTMQNIEKALNPKPIVDLSTLILKKYHEFLHLFSRETVN